MTTPPEEARATVSSMLRELTCHSAEVTFPLHSTEKLREYPRYTVAHRASNYSLLQPQRTRRQESVSRIRRPVHWRRALKLRGWVRRSSVERSRPAQLLLLLLLALRQHSASLRHTRQCVSSLISFTARHYAPSVCQSLRLSQAGTVWKQLDESSWFLARRLPSTHAKEIRLSTKNKSTFSGTFPQSQHLENFATAKSIVLSTKLVDDRPCWPHLRRSTRRCLTHIDC